MARSNYRPGGSLDAEPALVVPFPGRTPERLVGVGFRCWLSGFETGDISSWEEAWSTYMATLGTTAAKPVILSLSQFVRAVKTCAGREIETYPSGCRGFCRDECLAISIVAACQHGARPALAACASALTGNADIGDTIATAQTFAQDLRHAGQVLSPSSICPVNCPLRTSLERLQ